MRLWPVISIAVEMKKTSFFSATLFDRMNRLKRLSIRGLQVVLRILCVLSICKGVVVAGNL